MPFAEYDGIRVNYTEAGSGDPVLFLHGWGGRIESFAPVIDCLSERFRTIAIDFPGHGQSPEPPEAWSVSEYAELTAKFIREHAAGKCDIVAHSFGGRVAILLAAREPELVGKMILCDSAGLIPRRGAKYYFRVYSYKLMKNMAKTRAGNALLKLFGIDAKKRMANAGSADYRALSDNMKKTFVRVVNQNLRPYLKQIKAPVLLVWGDEDRETPIEFAKIMESEIPDAGLVVYKGSGHFAYLENLRNFCDVALYFLGGGQ